MVCFLPCQTGITIFIIRNHAVKRTSFWHVHYSPPFNTIDRLFIRVSWTTKHIAPKRQASNFKTRWCSSITDKHINLSKMKMESWSVYQNKFRLNSNRQGWKIQNDKYRIGGWIFQMRQIQSDSFIWTNLDAIQILPWTNSDGTFSYGQI